MTKFTTACSFTIITALATLLILPNLTHAQNESSSATIIQANASSSQNEHPPFHALDKNPKTKWAALGKNQYLQLKLDKITHLKSAQLGFEKGNQRRYTFEIQYSGDGKTWHTDSTHTSSGQTNSPQSYKCNNSAAIYIRIVSKGNNINDWINLHTLTLNDNTIVKLEHNTFQTNQSFKITPYAQAPMFSTPVAIAFDNLGNAYVTQTKRRKAADLDIRRHRDWIPDDLSFQTIEQKRKFYHDQLNPSRSSINKSWLKDLNNDNSHDYHDLTVHKESVILLKDTNNDGKADQAITYHKGMNTEISGIAGGVLHHQNKVYVTAIPYLYMLEDTNNDNIADKVKIIAEGFGPHIAYAGHDMHGLTVGPDGRIYWSIGDKGASVIRPDDGKRFHYPNQGLVFRCEPDGSNFEVYAHGLRNTQELAFNDYGDLISVDNDSDKGPDRERIVHITEGSDTGWRCNWQYITNDYNPWLNEQLFKPYFEHQAAYITPAVANYSNGPCGFAYNPGTALSPKWKNHFFLAEFTGSAANGKISAFTLKQNGATYQLNSSTLATQGILPTGIAFAPDGALYICDWIAGWEVHDKGKIWKLDTPTYTASDIRKLTRSLLAEDFTKRDINALTLLLRHDDQRVRLKAQFELVTRDREGIIALIRTTAQRTNQLARIHAIWGIGQFARKNPNAAGPLINLLVDNDPEIIAQAAKTLGDSKYFPANSLLAKLLTHNNPRVQFHAAIALGKLGTKNHANLIINMLDKNNDKDPYLRHAGAFALANIGDTESLNNLASHKNPALRVAAVVALRKLKQPSVATFLNDESEYVAAEAARAIHDDFSILTALPDLAKALLQENRTNESLLRRAINANYRLGDEPAAIRLATYASNELAPDIMRAAALETLTHFPNPPQLDPLEFRHRPHPNTNNKQQALNYTTNAFVNAALPIFTTGNDLVKTQAINTIVKLNINNTSSLLANLATNKDNSTNTRIAAIDALGQLKAAQLSTTINNTLADPNPKIRDTAKRWLAKTNPTSEAALNILNNTLQTGTTPQRQQALRDLSQFKSNKADTIILNALSQIQKNKLPLDIHLDIITAVEARKDNPKIASALTQYQKSIPADKPLEKFRTALLGGNAEKGKTIFTTHIAAQCIRCHSVAGQGGNVAPDLTKIATRLTRNQLLESLITPNAKIADGFGLVAITLKDKTQLSGTLKIESDNDIIIILPDGTPQTIKKSNIATRTPAISAMPPVGLILKPHEIRDIIEYLAQLK